ncbi:MAG: DNA repair protein RecN [Betaproteobacteria bacterium]|nr:DNA repair protein RecN [Betaproteobacteria bacterium]
MLLALRLRDFVIVDRLELEFGPGFTVLTGETGAGKSILIDALQLALGGRGDAGVVREGAARADIVAEFSLSPALDAWLAERDLAGDPGTVMLRRLIEADGRSRALVNGHPATVAQLRELGEQLVDVHGQHAAQSMLRAGGQRDLLDAFAQQQALAAEVAAAFGRWRVAQERLEQARAATRELDLERERLQWQLGELEQLAMAEGEWEALNEEHRRLAHAAALLEGARAAVDALAESDEAISGRLQAITQRLRPLAAIDARLSDAVLMLENACIQADEAASALSDYADRLDLDPERLAQLDQRIGQAFSLARKLRLAPEALASTLLAARGRLAELEATADPQRLQAEEAAAQEVFLAAAGRLSTARREAATRLARGVSARLQPLGMAGARFEADVQAADPGPGGLDRVEFRIAGHAGSQPRPLAKVASGGELSRVGLAVAVLAAQANPVPTLIFDEADAGVGGAVGEAIGQLMRTLGEARQVLCVTHLPQVAARAHQHLSVSKAEVGGRTVSRIAALDRQARIDEVARMLAGAEITATSRQHARELLAGA